MYSAVGGRQMIALLVSVFAIRHGIAITTRDRVEALFYVDKHRGYWNRGVLPQSSVRELGVALVHGSDIMIETKDQRRCSLAEIWVYNTASKARKMAVRHVSPVGCIAYTVSYSIRSNGRR
ncbi:hypothetical protein BJV74DRAFT_862029 [Russula compacta]|nr:hypothetical protein BJV74DRAFT_862029 [Russula compacta]